MKQLEPIHVVIIAFILIAALTTLVAMGKIEATVLTAPIAWFFGWLTQSPLRAKDSAS